MNPPIATEFAAGLALDLQAFHALCGEVLALVTRESQALSDQNDYQPGEFNQRRKRLLPELESALNTLSKRRQSRRQATQSEENTKLFQTIQSLLTKVLFLDRENQQALLRRGLVPAKHLPPIAAQRPHYVTGLYRQHSRVPGGVPV
jgi:hypothetical protein